MQGFCCPVDVHLQRRNRAGDAGCAVATWLLLAKNAVSEDGVAASSNQDIACSDWTSRRRESWHGNT